MPGVNTVPDADRFYRHRFAQGRETLAYLQSETALTVDYVTVAVVDARAGKR